MERAGGGVNRTLIAHVPGTVAWYDPPHLDTMTYPGTEVFNSNQFQQGFSGGPKIGLTYHGNSGYGAEISYFNIFDQSARKSVGPDGNWLVMKAPGAFWQTQDFPNQAMVWGAATNLYSAEANGRLALSSRITVLAGFRWLQLNDSLQGNMTPADVTEPEWKQTCPSCNLSQVSQQPPGPLAGHNPPFWNTSTANNLFGLQIGVDGKIAELGRFSLNGLIKLGVFDNFAEQSTGVSLRKQVYPTSATASRAAFGSEAGLQLKYRVSDALALKAGYEVLWLDGIALAPGQIQETVTGTGVRTLGVNARSNVLFQGITAGLEYSF